MTDVTEQNPAAEDDADGSSKGVWTTVGFFVAFVVLASSCVAIRIF